jgi:hypothetical protein
MPVSFQTAAYLRKATLRAKSDVANKLVSMFLHEVSRKMAAQLELSVADAIYAQAVETEFGVQCCYCGRLLEYDRAAVEHLDGMNRFRAGLHIPGNVIVSCKKCNNEKRRDDQIHELKLANSGWESFLSHDSTKCDVGCKTCRYWKTVWPEDKERIKNLKAARDKISDFRLNHQQSIELSSRSRDALRQELDQIYRECQSFATNRIKKAVETITKPAGNSSAP